MRLAFREVMLCVWRNLPLSSRCASASALGSLRQGKRGSNREADASIRKFHGREFIEAFLKTCPFWAGVLCALTMPLQGYEKHHLFFVLKVRNTFLSRYDLWPSLSSLRPCRA